MNTSLIGRTLLNQYNVETFVTTGGMVYRVWDRKRNVPLLMKVLHAGLAEDPSIFKRFKRGAIAFKKLAHPNIVPFYGLHHTDDFSFLLEQYVDGPTLKDILRQRKSQPLSIQEALTYLKALSAALDYAHIHGVVHCGVKPGNVMVDRGGSIYLTDFGIARLVESTSTTLVAVGSPAYMAPEQIRGEPVSPATDVYALGIMLFEMLTGKRPFSGDENGTDSSGPTAAERIRYAHLNLTPPNPRSLNPAISEALALVMLKALAKNPHDRFQTTQELYIACCQALGTLPDSVANRVALPEYHEEIEEPYLQSSPTPVQLPAPSDSQTDQEPSLAEKLKDKMGLLVTGGIAVLLLFLVLLWNPRNNNGSHTQTNTQSVGVLQIAIETTITKTPTPLPSSTPTWTSTPTHIRSPTLTHLLSPTSTPHTIRTNSIDGAKLVLIPAGEFLMGLTNPDISNMISMCPSCDPDTLRDQVPQRMVYLNGFWVDQTEVTNAQFEKFVRDTGYQTTAEQEGGSYLYDLQYRDFFYFKGTFWRYPQGVSSSITGRSDYPVLHASWDDAVAYCRWAGRRLPTEAEWEKAARGTNGLIFPWGNTPPNLQLLNFDRIVGAPSPVGSYPSGASPYGVLDMAGNLYEWVSDFYKESYYPEAPVKNPTGPISGEGHTLRGGSWATGAENKLLNLSTTFRIWNKAFIRSDVIGFRCAMSTSALP